MVATIFIKGFCNAVGLRRRRRRGDDDDVDGDEMTLCMDWTAYNNITPCRELYYLLTWTFLGYVT